MHRDDRGEARPVEPQWVTTTLWLTPTPASAVVAAAIAVFASLMCFFFATAEHSPIAWTLGGAFAALGTLFGAASIARQIHRQRPGASDSGRHTAREARPTAAIVIFLISVYTVMLTIGLHVFRNFFAANRPGGLKYNVTLGIAVASTAYMNFHGRSVIRKHFARGGRNITVSLGQALVVIALLLAIGAYGAWIMV